jgi:hypothetical protein
MYTFVRMSGSPPSSYFTGTTNLQQLDAAELEQQLDAAPFDASLRLLTAIKSGDVGMGQSMLYSRDRTFLAKMVEENSEQAIFLDQQDTGGMTEKQEDIKSNDVQVPVVLEPQQSDEEIEPFIPASEDITGQGDPDSPAIPGKKKKKKGGTAAIKRKTKPSFRLKEYSGISPFAQWLVSFKVDDLEKRLKKEAKKEKKRLLEENARKSVTRSSSTISEPLAEILRIQGHFEDAKKMYGQLMQKFPEKSSYFAAKIDEINKVT